MHEQVFARYPDAVAMGEMSCGITPEQGVDYVSTEDGNRQLQLIIHFEHVELDCVDGDKWILRTFQLPELKTAVTKWQTKMAEVGGWDTVWMENHVSASIEKISALLADVIRTNREACPGSAVLVGYTASLELSFSPCGFLLFKAPCSCIKDRSWA